MPIARSILLCSSVLCTLVILGQLLLPGTSLKGRSCPREDTLTHCPLLPYAMSQQDHCHAQRERWCLSDSTRQPLQPLTKGHISFEHQNVLRATSSPNPSLVTSTHTSNCSQMIWHAACPGISVILLIIWAPTLTSVQNQPPDMPHGVTQQKTKPELRFQAGAYPDLATFMTVPKAHSTHPSYLFCPTL